MKTKVLLIIHSYDAHFELLYTEFRDRVASFCDIDIYFHHYNVKILELILTRNIDSYDLFAISSFNHPRIGSIIGRIPANKVLIVSRNDRIEKRYNEIVQDFFEGTINGLIPAVEKIRKYENLTLSFPLKSGHPETLKMGFEKFCTDYSIDYKIVDSLKNTEISKGSVYLVVDDSDLVKLLKICKIRSWKPGRDLGVISYNETPLKEVIRDGITVVSCNFNSMADEMAEFVETRLAVQKKIPITLILRNSL